MKKYILLLPAVFLSGCVTTNTVNVKNTLKASNTKTLIEILKTDEVQIGRLSMARKKPVAIKQKSTRDLNKLNKMARRLIKRSPTPNLKIPIRLEKCGAVLVDRASNDGTVTICKETLEQLKYEDEVAFLLAHEMSHHILNHAPETNSYMSEQKGYDKETEEASNSVVGLGAVSALYLGTDITSTINGKTRFRKGDKKAASKRMLQVSGAMIASDIYFQKIQPKLREGYGAGLNRKEESEADALAIDLISKSGWNPGSSTAFFTLMESKENAVKEISKNTEVDNKADKNIDALAAIDELNGLIQFDNIVDAVGDKLATGTASLINFRDHGKTSARMEFASAYVKKFYRKNTSRKKRKF